MRIRKLSLRPFFVPSSKVALVYLVRHLRERGFRLFDIQMQTEHTTRLGAIEISRKEYLRRLREALACPVRFTDPA